MSALGLNEHHQGTAVNYMRFARYQRGQRLRAVKGCFEDLKDSRLIEDTFTLDEVRDMLDGLHVIVRGEVESELINTAHTNVLLLRQLFLQAEKWHLKLQADISELENRELLEKIKDFEECEFAGGRRGDASKPIFKLEPMNEQGGAALLNMEIERLQEENHKLKSKLQSVEQQAANAHRERGELKSALDKSLRDTPLAAAAPGDQAEVEELRRTVKQLRMAVDQTSAVSGKRSEELVGELSGTKHELLRVQDMLELAEKELEKKVSQTAPFKNLKQMLQKKNEQLKDLRKRLSKYETVDD